MVADGFAPAKLNLAPHITGRRPDGYHFLDSLVVFVPGVGDRVSAQAATDLSLDATGPMAGDLPPASQNLVLRAARWLAPGRGAALTLHKRLPVASGLGGGSADAAAVLRVLSGLWEVPVPDPSATAALGGDVPVCLLSEPRRMTGVGECLARVPALPPLDLLLVNPGVALATQEVFAALDSPVNAPMEAVPSLVDPRDFVAWLQRQRNDLEPPARRLAPVIGEVLARLRRSEGCLIARMSGSGATCFGLFASATARDRAARALRHTKLNWWVAGDAVR